MPPPTTTTTTAFHQSLAPTSAYARHLSHAHTQAYIYRNPAPAPAPQRTERDIIVAHHRFLHPTAESSPGDNDYERTLALTYDSKLYKEFVLMELGRWREGMVAMRWRTEEEVKGGKGERVCAALDCDGGASMEREMVFQYREDGEAREALVKASLCGGCAEKLERAQRREKRRSERSRKEDLESLRGEGGGREHRKRKKRRERSGSPCETSQKDDERGRGHRRKGGRSRLPSQTVEEDDTEIQSRRKGSRSRHGHRSKPAAH